MVVGPTAESWTYSYDGIDRLLSAANSADTSTSRTFVYDDAGNMTNNSGLGAYTYPTQGAGAVRPHAVTAAGSNSYVYNANGNMTSGTGRTLSYDGENRLTSVVNATATTAYGYGPDADRIKTIVTPVSGPVETSYILGSTEIDDASIFPWNQGQHYRPLAESGSCESSFKTSRLRSRSKVMLLRSI